MIDSIKNLFGGLLSFLTGLFGGKKSQKNLPSEKPSEKPTVTTAKKRKSRGYFMELDEADEMKPLNGNQPAGGAAAKTPEHAAAKPATEPAKTPEPVAAKPAKGEPAKTPEPVKVELVQTAKGVRAKPAEAPAASLNGQSLTETTFAPKYLIPSSSSSRRRPGPNMNSFLDMANQVKTSS